MSRPPPLAPAGLVTRRKDGARVIYALSSPVVERAGDALGVLAGAVVLDVRPEAEYVAGHGAGAVSAPPHLLADGKALLALVQADKWSARADE